MCDLAVCQHMSDQSPNFYGTPVTQGAELFPFFLAVPGAQNRFCDNRVPVSRLPTKTALTNRRQEPMHKRRTSSRVLIIGKTDRRVELLKHYLADYFGKVDLLTDLEQLNSLSADNFTVIVVTDTFGDVLKSDFFADIRSLHPRAGLLCLFDRISRQTEKDMRSAGLLFLGSYEHFDDCYSSVLERALWPQKTSKHRPQGQRSIQLHG